MNTKTIAIGAAKLVGGIVLGQVIVFTSLFTVGAAGAVTEAVKNKLNPVKEEIK